ncbi:hypothetical protein LCGC14_1647820, partial [marine sediment metagenome]
MPWPRKTHKQFVVDIAKIHLGLSVVSQYTDSREPIVVMDENGIKYKVGSASLMAGHYPRMGTAINKTGGFKTKLAQIQPNLIVLGEYINNRVRVLVRDELGIEYLSSPDTLLGGSPPSILTATDRNKAFEIKSRLIHGDKYDYSKVNYKDATIKVKIGCPIHGYFMQFPADHSCTGCGCPKCGNINSVLNSFTGGWTKTSWIELCKNQNAEPKLYIIHCFN